MSTLSYSTQGLIIGGVSFFAGQGGWLLGGLGIPGIIYIPVGCAVGAFIATFIMELIKYRTDNFNHKFMNGLKTAGYSFVYSAIASIILVLLENVQILASLRVGIMYDLITAAAGGIGAYMGYLKAIHDVPSS